MKTLIENYGRASSFIKGVFARLIHNEAMMGVLDGRDPVPARNEARDDPGEERGLARPAPAGEADDAHAPL